LNDIPFIIRSAREDDIEEIYRLANLVYFINLPADREILKEKIRISMESFSGTLADKFAREYIFVLQNVEDGNLVGSSMVIARHGSPASSAEEFVAAVKPKLAIFSVAHRNRFGLPRREVLERYAKAGAEILRTDQDGAIVLETDGKEIRYRTYASGKREVFALGSR